MSNSSTTTAPIQAGDFTGLSPEFGRIASIQQMFGLKRGTLYNLINAKKIRSVLKRVTGQKSGIRLIDVASVRAYILSDIDNGEVL
jgi:hypothetical protein